MECWVDIFIKLSITTPRSWKKSISHRIQPVAFRKISPFKFLLPTALWAFSNMTFCHWIYADTHTQIYMNESTEYKTPKYIPSDTLAVLSWRKSIVLLCKIWVFLFYISTSLRQFTTIQNLKAYIPKTNIIVKDKLIATFKIHIFQPYIIKNVQCFLHACFSSYLERFMYPNTECKVRIAP